MPRKNYVVTVPIAVIRYFNNFTPHATITDIKLLHDAGIDPDDIEQMRSEDPALWIYEVNARLAQWQLGADAFFWLTGNGTLMANASTEREPRPRGQADKDRPGRNKFEHDSHYNYFKLGRKVIDWENPRFYFEREIEEVRAQEFFQWPSERGLVPDLRKWVIEQMDATVKETA